MHHWVSDRPEIVTTVSTSLKEEFLKIWTCFEAFDFLGNVPEQLVSDGIGSGYDNWWSAANRRT